MAIARSREDARALWRQWCSASGRWETLGVDGSHPPSSILHLLETSARREGERVSTVCLTAGSWVSPG